MTVADYETKKQDYYALFRYVGLLLEKFRDYTPEREKELDETVNEAAKNASDLKNGPELFKIVGGYIKYRYIELNEYRERREKAERKLMEGLPVMFDDLAVPGKDSCLKLAKALQEHTVTDNYQILKDNVISLIADV